MDSDSDDERAAGYVPVLAQSLNNSKSVSSPSRPEASQWLKDGVSLYTNELFTDGGDVLGGDPQQHGLASPTQNGGTGMRRGPSLAAKRQERLQAGTPYTPNSLLKGGSMPRGQSPGSPGLKAMPESPSYRPSNLSQSTNGPLMVASASAGLGGATHGGAGMYNNLRMEYDPNEGMEETTTTNRYSAQQERSSNVYRSVPNSQLDLSDMPTFLMTPGPKAGPVQCVIVRDRGPHKMYPRYALFLEEGRRFLMSARKRKHKKTSNYVISLDYDDLSRESGAFFGKVRANFVGTEFTVYDSGSKPGKGEDATRQELGAVTYQYNVLGTRGPRKMTAAIPAVDGSGRSQYRPQGDADNILERVKNRKGWEELVVMGNKPPRWNEELSAYCLNFNGRVTEASVKNFQLVADDNHNHVILQFGKVGKDTFTMDYQWPISAFQAFAICMSSFDNKLACE